MVNHATGSQALFAALGHDRVAVAFPGAAGVLEDGVVRYVEVAEQPTAIESRAVAVAEVFRGAGFRIASIDDMDAWLKRHAVFITAICGAIYDAGGSASSLAAARPLVRAFILAVREGWAALDLAGVAPEALPLRVIFRWAPMPLASLYWRRLLASVRGEYYFARHARHAVDEMAALAADVRHLTAGCPAPNLLQLLGAIDRARRAESSSS
jgi:hypothetical protein